MKCEIYSSMEWIYPDQMQENGTKNVNLYVAKNSSECFQILTDYQAKETERITYSFTGDQAYAFSTFARPCTRKLRERIIYDNELRRSKRFCYQKSTIRRV